MVFLKVRRASGEKGVVVLMLNMLRLLLNLYLVGVGPDFQLGREVMLY
jgi:hypothetical protein